jgi:hypothetical protein
VVNILEMKLKKQQIILLKKILIIYIKKYYTDRSTNYRNFHIMLFRCTILKIFHSINSVMSINIILLNSIGFGGLSADIGPIIRIPYLTRVNAYLKILDNTRYRLREIMP